MLGRLPRGKRNLALAVLGALALWFAWSIRSVLNPLLIGYLGAYVLHPFVVRVEGLGFSKRAAVNLTFFSGFVVAALLSLVVVLQMRGLALEVVRSVRPEAAPASGLGEPASPESTATMPQTLEERLKERWEAFRKTVDDWVGIDLGTASEHGLDNLDAFEKQAKNFLLGSGGEAGAVGLDAARRTWGFLSRFLGGVLAVGGLFLLVPLYAYYLLFELGRLHGFVRRYLPRRDREHLAAVAEKIGVVIASFFRGRLAVCFLKGLFLSLGLWAAEVDYAFLFGMLSGFLSLIPFFGAFLGFLVATLAGVLDHSVLGALVRTGIVFGLGELLEGYVLLPKVLGDRLGLHPLVVLFAMLAGGATLGMLGILVALPLTATLVILTKEFVLPAMQKLADE
ncbi:MAG: AI-2E family transporter [Planctomycetota bacterium]